MTRWLLLVWILLFSHVPQLLAFDSITVFLPSSLAARITRIAISPRLAIRIF